MWSTVKSKPLKVAHMTLYYMDLVESVDNNFMKIDRYFNIKI